MTIRGRKPSPVWFEFKGESSRKHGVDVKEWPTREMPALNASMQKVVGRSGSVMVTDGAYQDVNVDITFRVPDRTRMSEVNVWLTGSGLLRFSDEPDLAYEAHVIKNVKHNAVNKYPNWEEYKVAFSCKPFRVQAIPAGEITITTSGTEIIHPGNAPALPMVTILGSGDFTVAIGEQEIEFTDVPATGIVVDSVTMDAINVEGTALLNGNIDGTPWMIQPGKSTVTWSVETGSSITSIKILPRWRWF